MAESIDEQTNIKINKAIKQDNLYIFNQLLINELKGNMNHTLPGNYPKTDDTLLMRSCRYGSKKIIEYLLENKVEIDRQKSANGITAIFVAARKGYYDIFMMLINKKANYNILDNDGLSPIIVAAQNGRYKIFKFLINKNVSPNICTKSGITMLCVAAANDQYKIVKKLLNKKADPNIQGEKGLSPLGQASQNGHHKIVELLLDNGANPNIQDVYGITALHRAIANNHHKVVKLLLNKGADPNLYPSIYKSPIHIAATQLQVKTVKLLALNGANYSHDYINSMENDKMSRFIQNHHKFIKKISPVLSLLRLAREFCEESLFHKDYLPYDLFKILFLSFKDEIEYELY